MPNYNFLRYLYQLSHLASFSFEPCDWIFQPHWFVGNQDKKAIILSTCSTSRFTMNRAQNADHTARTCERFVYPVVKMTRLYDYQTWQKHFLGEIHKVCKGIWSFFSLLYFLDAVWHMDFSWQWCNQTWQILHPVEHLACCVYNSHIYLELTHSTLCGNFFLSRWHYFSFLQFTRCSRILIFSAGTQQGDHPQWMTSVFTNRCVTKRILSPNSWSNTNFSFPFIASYVWYSMEKLAGDLLLEAKFV